MSEDLKSALSDMSMFIQLADGDSFEGVYKGFQRVQSNFDPEKEVIELNFEINGKDKTMISMSLPKELVLAGVVTGDKVTVKRVSTKGNKVTWRVDKK